MCLIGNVTIQDLNLPVQNPSRPLRSVIQIAFQKSTGAYLLCIKNSMHPTSVRYNIANLKSVHSKFVGEGKLTLLFNQPKHQIMLQTDDKPLLSIFLQQIRGLATGKPVHIRSQPLLKKIPPKKKKNNFDPTSRQFVALDRFDKRILNMYQLTSLSLENCKISCLPMELGNLPISYLNLSGSTLPSSGSDKDTLWNWMAADKISNSLIILKMDSIGLESVPFEMMFLQNLQELSLNKNSLKFIPYCIGSFKKLHTLCVADNMLKVLPVDMMKLDGTEYKLLDISNNSFIPHREIPPFTTTDRKDCVPSLLRLSYYSIVKNCIKFKRQDVPRSLWKNFNLIKYCEICKSYVLSDYIGRIFFSRPNCVEIRLNHIPGVVPFELARCCLNA